MSHRIASIHAYDVMDTIVWSARVADYDDLDQDHEPDRVIWAGSFPSTGHPFAPHWLMDVLQDILSAL